MKKSNAACMVMGTAALMLIARVEATEVQGDSVKGGDHQSVKFTGNSKPYGITASAKSGWEFRDATHISNTLNWHADSGSSSSHRWGQTNIGTTVSDNELFSIRISGKIVPVGPGSGPPPPTDWSVKGTIDGDFSISPSTLKIGIKKTGSFTANNGGSSNTTWVVTPFDGGAALAGHPTGTSITVGTDEDIVVPGGKWIVTATEGSQSDTAVLTVVKTEKILVDGEEGPALVLEGESATLKAIPYPSGESYPSGCPDWSVDQKPSGSALADPADGSSSVTVNIDKVGKYRILADFAFADLIGYKFEFVEEHSSHYPKYASMEGYVWENGNLERLNNWNGSPIDFIGTYGNFAKQANVTSKNHADLSFGMDTNCTDFLADYPNGYSLQPSGDLKYKVNLNVGNATGVPISISAAWSDSGKMLPLNSSTITNGAGPGVLDLLNGQYVSILYTTSGRGVQPNSATSPLTKFISATGVNYIGRMEVGIDYQDCLTLPSAIGLIHLDVDFLAEYGNNTQ
ncbi:MAG: hypothetical protein GXP32_07695 [Kiritimatiellaeota bacterium]|nr:hypothetical protein [Kiritimatiellota bacterium]